MTRTTSITDRLLRTHKQLQFLSAHGYGKSQRYTQLEDEQSRLAAAAQFWGPTAKWTPVKRAPRWSETATTSKQAPAS